jgi:hypothetical protein
LPLPSFKLNEIDDERIDSLNVTEIVEPVGTSVAPNPGFCEMTVGAVVSAGATVPKDQLTAVIVAVPVASFAPLAVAV